MIALPPEIHKRDIDDIFLEGSHRYIAHTLDMVTTRWTPPAGNDIILVWDFDQAQVRYDDAATQEDIDTLTAGIAARVTDDPRKTRAEQIIAEMSSMVGKTPAELSAQERNQLLKLVLWNMGVLDNTQRVRPLDTWVTRYPQNDK